MKEKYTVSETNKEKEVSEKANTSLSFLLKSLEEATNKREETLLKSLSQILIQFQEQRSQYPAKRFELENVKKLLENVQGDTRGFNLLRTHIFEYIEKLNDYAFKKIKTRIINTLNDMSESEFEIFTSFLSTTDYLGSKALAFFNRQSQREFLIEKLASLEDKTLFAQKLLGQKNIEDITEIEEKLKNAISLIEEMIKNRKEKE